MANAKISALPAVTTPVTTDEFAVNQSGTTKKETRAQIHTLESGEFLQGTTGAGVIDIRGDSGATVNLRLTDAGLLLLGDTTNANMTVGYTQDMGAANNQAICLKSSTVATVLTSATDHNVETDDFLILAKTHNTGGGMQLQSMMVNQATPTAVRLISYGGQASATKSTAGRALVEVEVHQHDGANSLSNIGGNGNVWGVRARVAGAVVTRFLVDEDGDTWQSGSITAVEGVFSSNVEIDGAFNHDGSSVGFYGTAPVAKQTGVAQTAAALQAALVNLGLITAA